MTGSNSISVINVSLRSTATIVEAEDVDFDPEQTRLDSHEEGNLLGEMALRMYPTCNNPFLGKRHALN